MKLMSELELEHGPESCNEEHGESGETNPGTIDWLPVLLKVAAGVVCFILLSVILEHFVGEQVKHWSRELMEVIGLPGLFICVLLADGIPQPFSYVPLIFLAVKGAVPKLNVFIVCAAASYSAAVCGYGIGYSLRGPSWGMACFERLEKKYPQIPELISQKGAFGVLMAAILPVPLAVATWTAGFFGVSIPYFSVAALGRGPKIAVFVLLSRT